MKKIISLSIMSAACLVLSCKPDYTIPFAVINNSSSTIAITLSYDYPNLQLPTWDKGYGYLRNVYPKRSGGGYSVTSGTWRDQVHNNPKDTLLLFFISADTLKKYGDNEIGYNAIRSSSNILGYKFITINNVKSDGSILVNYP